MQKQELKIGGSADFEMRRAIIYRENYLRMFKDKFSDYAYYDEIVKKLKEIQNPLDFYETISNLESGEKLKDITFMYNAVDMQKLINKFAEEIGIEEIDDSEFEEGD